jgi:2'-5' RNA ligase
MNSIYVSWERPRRFSVKMYGKITEKRSYTPHVTVGVVALSVATAIEAAQKAYPEYRIDSVNDTGQVDIVTDLPVRKPVPGEWVDVSK